MGAGATVGKGFISVLDRATRPPASPVKRKKGRKKSKKRTVAAAPRSNPFMGRGGFI